MSKFNRVPRRYTRQQQQEDLSASQLSECLTTHGWVMDRIGRDLGEDFLVRIYDDGVSTGLSFYVQLKSTKKLRVNTASQNKISFRLKVKDLEHWSYSTTPLFLIIWDVGKHSGYWANLHTLIAELNGSKPNWKTQKTSVIHLPKSQEVDNVGLEKIRWQVAEYVYPSVSKGKNPNIQIQLSLPTDTEAGQQALAATKRFVTSGDAIELDKRHIPSAQLSVQYSEWYQRLFGLYGKQDLGYLKITPVSSGTTMPVKLELFTADGKTAAIPYIALRDVRKGVEEITLSNEHQRIPFQVTMTINVNTHTKIDFSLENVPANIQDVKDALEFLRLLSEGGELQYTILDTGEKSERLLPKSTSTLSVDTRSSELIDMLATIQELTSQRLELEWWDINPRDEQQIRDAYFACTAGIVDLQGRNFPLSIAQGGLNIVRVSAFSEQGARMVVKESHSTANFSGVEVDLGSVEYELHVTPEITLAEFDAKVSKLQQDERLPINFRILDGSARYIEWPKLEKGRSVVSN